MSSLLRYDCENSKWKNRSHGYSLFPLVNLLQLQLHLSCARFMLRLLKVLLHFEYQEGKNGHQR